MPTGSCCLIWVRTVIGRAVHADSVVYLFDLIPAHQAQNRMTFESMMTSFGHSLQMSGNVLFELVKRRERLFASPPPLSVGEEASLVDFGETCLTPPKMPAARMPPELPVRKASLVPSSPAKSVAETPRPSVSHQRSLSSLLNVGKVSRRVSAELLGKAPPSVSIHIPIVDLEPPKIDMPLDSPALPTFGEEPEAEISGVAAQDVPVASVERNEDVHYASGTVAERARMFTAADRSPTPIADRFTGGASNMPSFRDSTASHSTARDRSPSLSVHSIDPRTSKRTSPFFATAQDGERIRHRHSRSLSGPKLESATEMSKLQDESKSPMLGEELTMEGEAKADAAAHPAA